MTVKKPGKKKESNGYFRILSIDGGGIRGIIPGQVLVALEEKLKTKFNKDARISDYFDLIAGTSTGGILTCMLLCPDSRNPKKPAFTAEQAVELYLERGDEIFDVSIWQKLSSGFGLADEKYSAQELEDILREYLRDVRLNQLIKPCLITSYDIKRRRAHFFNQMDAKNKGDGWDFYIRDVARATSAAPTYFEAARIYSFAELPYPLVDGGVFANNPAMCAYAEARESFPAKPTAKQMVILSLGTGHAKKKYLYGQAKDWGKLEWVVPLIDILMTGVSETVDYQLKQIFDSVGAHDQYLRINPKLIHAKPDMDDASEDNLRALKQEGIEVAQKMDSELDKFVKFL